MSAAFRPIAIVGQSCVLPGVLSPTALWRAVMDRRDLISSPADGEWGTDARAFLQRSEGPIVDRAISDRGGYVRGFDGIFDPSGFAIPAAHLRGLDPLFLWLLHCSREALAATRGHERARQRAGLIVGNLSYPTRGHADFAFETWLPDAAPSEHGRPRAENRFSSGYPAQLTARALDLGLGGFALDAACASSLYALKLACDRLHDGEADLMLTAAVNHADSLFLHIGFTALQALSPSGRSRPFHRGADGLLPAEGAACVALKRLEDAERDGDEILGVIRGIGLSNNGARRGLLTPDADGQIDALTAAYMGAGIDPAEVSLLECHATGTAVGDGVEIASAAQVFAGARDLPVGSLKSNLGHLVTAAGLAGLIKVLHAIKAHVRPPTLHADEPIDAFDGTPLRPLHAAEPWDSDRPRIAGISAFGFGGCNAHLVVEEWSTRDARRISVAAPAPAAPPTVAVCGIGIVTGAGHDYEAFCQRLFDPIDPQAPRWIAHAELQARTLRFPPADLAASLPQQTLMLEAALGALTTQADHGRTGVIVGMGCDPEITRFGMRWHAPDRVQDDFCPPLTAAGVIGTMPNVPANRLNVHADARAFGYTVSAEELSGVIALRLAARALAAGDADSVIVGAVEAVGDRVHEAAVAALLPASRHRAGDAAVALLVMSPARARALGVPIRALIDLDGDRDRADRTAPHETPALALTLDERESVVTARFGHAHAASGLLHVAAAIAACERAMQPVSTGTGVPWIAPWSQRQMPVNVMAFDGSVARCIVRASEAVASPGHDPVVRLFAAEDESTLLRMLVAETTPEQPGAGARVRLAIVAEDADGMGVAIESTRSQLESGRSPSGEGIYFTSSTHAIAGDLAFVFPGAAAAYAGAGRELLRAVPELADRLASQTPGLDRLATELFGKTSLDAPFDQLRACTLVCQAHARLCLDLLALRPAAALGLSSGETNALMAFGAWRDLAALLADIEASEMYGRFLTGACESAGEAWGLPSGARVDWTAWRLLAPAKDVQAIIEHGRLRAAVTIVNTAEDCVIAGERAACEAIITALGPGRAIDLRHPMVVHCAEMRPFEETWRRVHTRRTYPAPGVRFYSNACNAAYEPTAASIADALTAQAIASIDFPRTVEQAWADGVRVFLELGPRDTLTNAIGRILRDRPHAAIALDGAGSTEPARVARAVARLHVAGVDITQAALTRVFGAHPPAPAMRPLRFETRRPPFVPLTREIGELMEPAPSVPPVLHRRPVAPWRPSPALGNAPYVAGGRARVISDVERVHREFIEQQTRLYRTYLGVQTQLMDRLHRARAIGPSAASASAVAVVTGPPPTPMTIEQRAIQPRRPGVTPTRPIGPAFDRRQVETLAGGRISDVFGPAFRGQDLYRRQVRLPEPPMLLVDRVVGIAGEPGSMGRGTIWTESDVRADAWYLHQAHMPPGILIESGQADLLLISWLGVDALNRDERVYRLLGCELTFHGERLPMPGDTLHYEIHVDGHARTGDVRLFFFHYDCWIGDRRWISVRNGQAGFFTRAELAESGGVLWDAASETPKSDARLDAPPRPSTKRAFSRTDVDAFVAGDAYACFGEGFEEIASHQRTPSTPAGRMRLIDEVTAFDPRGGPWGRGYLRAEADVPTDAWFYRGHFKNDPCMPGTLMADAAVQAQSFLMAALGFTIGRDGWRFEPMVEETYKFVCRGQVVPDAPHRLTYEVFVEEIEDGPEPRLHASLLCRSDGFKVFQCRRLGVRLVPDWPLSTRQDQLPAVASHVVDPAGPVRGDYAALLACAWGRPSDAFGPMYAAFDGARRAPRLPGPPYHFMTHVEQVTCPSGRVTEGGRVTARYDVPPDAWYFHENAAKAMPLAVLMEVLLQPCGWLASYMGIAATAATDVRFRNLDGTNVSIERHVTPDTGSLTTTATLTRFARAGETILVFLHVDCRDRDGLVIALDTSFGFFTDAALAGQTGLPEPAALSRPDDDEAPTIVDLDVACLADRVGGPCVAHGSLLMLDRITAFWPDGGAAGLGRIRGHQTVRPDAWYFKAHFYQDPVQPGSLGVEALVQLLQIAMRLKGLHDGMIDPAFEPIAVGEPLVWRYRGQVLPRNTAVSTEIEIMRIDRHVDRIVCTAKGSLWCDGLRIYELPSLAMTLVDCGNRTLACTPEAVREHWRARLGIADWPGEALMTALLRRFVSRVSIADPDRLAALSGQPVLYLANHQVGVESMLFSFALGGLLGRPVIAIAKGEHQDSWLGRLYECLGTYPGVTLPRMALFFDRDDRARMLDLMREARRLLQDEHYSMLVHVEGTRSTRAGEPVRRVSAVLLDLMSAAGVPIVPVRFAGGLPNAGDGAGAGAEEQVRREFPVSLGQQEIFMGAPIGIDALRDLPLRDKQRAIADAINGLGGPLASEVPAAASPHAEARIAQLAARAGLQHTRAVVLDTLAEDRDAAPLFARVLAVVDGAHIALTPWERAFLEWAKGY